MGSTAAYYLRPCKLPLYACLKQDGKPRKSFQGLGNDQIWKQICGGGALASIRVCLVHTIEKRLCQGAREGEIAVADRDNPCTRVVETDPTLF